MGIADQTRAAKQKLKSTRDNVMCTFDSETGYSLVNCVERIFWRNPVELAPWIDPHHRSLPHIHLEISPPSPKSILNLPTSSNRDLIQTDLMEAYRSERVFRYTHPFVSKELRASKYSGVPYLGENVVRENEYLSAMVNVYWVYQVQAEKDEIGRDGYGWRRLWSFYGVGCSLRGVQDG